MMLYNKDFIDVAESIICPKYMFISHNDGKVNSDFLPSRDIMINANGMKSLTNTLNSFIETHPVLTRGVFYAVAGFTAYVAVVKTLMIAKSALAVGTTLLATKTLFLNGVVTTTSVLTKTLTVAGNDGKNDGTESIYFEVLVTAKPGEKIQNIARRKS